MRKSFWKAWPVAFLLPSPAFAQSTIHVRVVSPGPVLVPSEIQFRRSSTAPWEALNLADRGEADITFGCSPGTQLRADPLNGRYTNSGAVPCASNLVLQVAERSVGFAMDAAGGNLSREDFATRLARHERAEDGDVATPAHGEAVDRYLDYSRELKASERESAQVRLLNESSDLFDRVDKDHDERLSHGELASGPN